MIAGRLIVPERILLDADGLRGLISRMAGNCIKLAGAKAAAFIIRRTTDFSLLVAQGFNSSTHQSLSGLSPSRPCDCLYEELGTGDLWLSSVRYLNRECSTLLIVDFPLTWDEESFLGWLAIADFANNRDTFLVMKPAMEQLNAVLLTHQRLLPQLQQTPPTL